MVDRLFSIVRNDSIKAGLALALVLCLCFFPAVVGTKTLLLSASDTSSITRNGAYGVTAHLRHHAGRAADQESPGALAEPLLKIESRQYMEDLNSPLWNPHSAYGTPLAAAMQPQPFFPLAILLALHLTPYTYNLFVLARLFVAGMFMFLFMRWFLPFLPSIFAAVAFMLTGYFINYLNMPHLSVEVLLPAVFCAFEGVLRRKSFGAVAAAAAVVMMAILGGMPESTFLVLTFGYIYFFVRMFLDGEFSREKTVQVRNFVLVNLFGFALAAFLLFPFMEFLNNSYNAHQPANLGGFKCGLSYDSDPRDLIYYLIPLTHVTTSNYWGLLAVLFAVFAAGSHCHKSSKSLEQPLVNVSLFFGAAILLMLLKRYGCPVVNWVGGLPLFEMVIFTKYQGPLLAFSWAALAGIGFEVFMEGKIRPPLFFLSLGCIFATILGLSIWSFPQLFHGKLPGVFTTNLVLAVILLLTVAVAYRKLYKDGQGFTALIRWGTVALLALEMSFFLVASFYFYNALPPSKDNPYLGAPYLTFLESKDVDRSRVFAKEGLLLPNWAGVFGLDDVRCLDAMYYRRYIHFIRNFLSISGHNSGMGDLADRFTGSDSRFSYDFDNETEKRFLALSSIRYLIAMSDYGNPNHSKIKDIFSQHKDEGLWNFGLDNARIEGESIRMLLQHPPSHRVTYRVTIDEKRPVLEFCVLLKPEVHHKNDGVVFLLELRSGGVIDKLFTATLMPKTRPADRKAVYHRIDLSEYAGQEVELLFSTDPCPGGKIDWAWAGWGAVRFTSTLDEALAPSPFKEIYNDEVKIFEFPHVLPRAGIYRGIEIVEDESDILTRLKEPSFDAWKNALVWGGPLSVEDRRRLQEIGPAGDRQVAPARIVSYKSRQVVIEASTEEPSLLMLNDANYPGWKVYVNGHREPILNADYLFRGVILPRGHSTVEFVYTPFSFVAGMAMSLSALIAGLVLFVVKMRRGAKVRTLRA